MNIRTLSGTDAKFIIAKTQQQCQHVQKRACIIIEK